MSKQIYQGQLSPVRDGLADQLEYLGFKSHGSGKAGSSALACFCFRQVVDLSVN